MPRVAKEKRNDDFSAKSIVTRYNIANQKRHLNFDHLELLAIADTRRGFPCSPHAVLQQDQLLRGQGMPCAQLASDLVVNYANLNSKEIMGRIRAYEKECNDFCAQQQQMGAGLQAQNSAMQSGQMSVQFDQPVSNWHMGMGVQPGFQQIPPMSQPGWNQAQVNQAALFNFQQQQEQEQEQQQQQQQQQGPYPGQFQDPGQFGNPDYFDLWQAQEAFVHFDDYFGPLNSLNTPFVPMRFDENGLAMGLLQTQSPAQSEAQSEAQSQSHTPAPGQTQVPAAAPAGASAPAPPKPGSEDEDDQQTSPQSQGSAVAPAPPTNGTTTPPIMLEMTALERALARELEREFERPESVESRLSAELEGYFQVDEAN